MSRDLETRQSIAGALGVIRDLGWTPGAIIDIGVALGTKGLYDVWPGVPICLVDPNPDNRVYMEQIAAKHAQVSIWIVGASNICGEMPGRIWLPSGRVILGQSATKPDWQGGMFSVLTCDEIVRRAGISGPFVFKIDTDTHEGEILEGATDTLANSEICIIEVGIYNHLKGKFASAELFSRLTQAGFALIDIIDTRHVSSGVLRLADLVFAKATGDVIRRCFAVSHKDTVATAATRIAQRQRALAGNNEYA